MADDYRDDVGHTAEDFARISLAAQMRRGMHLLVGREPSVDDMTALASALEGHFDDLEATAPRGVAARAHGRARKRFRRHPMARPLPTR